MQYLSVVLAHILSEIYMFIQTDWAVDDAHEYMYILFVDTAIFSATSYNLLRLEQSYNTLVHYRWQVEIYI